MILNRKKNSILLYMSMSNKITLDFENNLIIWDTDSQNGIEHCPELAERHDDILKAIGYEDVPGIKFPEDIEEMVNNCPTLENFLNKYN